MQKLPFDINYSVIWLFGLFSRKNGKEYVNLFSLDFVSLKTVGIRSFGLQFISFNPNKFWF